MLRVRCYGPVLFCFVLAIFAQAAGECRYKDETHPEGTEVPTAEPCLNCTCSRGALLCYLRVCPPLPNPPPVGCILLHKYKTCCPELICTDLLKNGNGVEARAEPDEPDIFDGRRGAGNACVVNGSIYGAGSAMDSSSLCEYCYCLGGKQVCIQPKCLLPLDNCQPVFHPSNCCPVRYKCRRPPTLTTTTTSKSRESETGGCVVDGVHYKEGGKVLNIGHSACDNCYCLRGILRCEPLSCAPPLFGCSPVVRPGECCAVSYNCSGAIQIKPEPTYGELSVSKEYAKLQKLFSSEGFEARTTKIQRNSDSVGTTRQLFHSTVVPYYKNLSNFITDDGESTVSVLDDRINRKVEVQTTTDVETTYGEDQTTTELSTTTEPETDSTTGSTEDTTETTPFIVTLQTVLNSTDCINSNASESNETTTLPYGDGTNPSESELSLRNTATTSYSDLQTNSSENSTHPFKPDLIFSLDKTKNSDYEYDYNEPSLPPSLPNVRIIPFVAADALDLQNTEHNALYSKDHVTDAPIHYNLFSPPVETEGGFVPKEPPILDNFYDIATSTTSFPKLQMNCVVEDREVLHGELVASESSCSTCSCYYGNIVCQKMECPLSKIDCPKVPDPDLALCCPHFVCEDATASEDSFKDVIRTEPAPNLQSLIVDFDGTTTTELPKLSKTSSDNHLSFDKVLSLLFFNRDDPTTTTTEKVEVTSGTSFDKVNKKDDSRHMNAVDSPSMAILKLAGCNIYGRMYRVGRIISELSNPCLECRCTETGVQCRDLDC